MYTFILIFALFMVIECSVNSMEDNIVYKPGHEGVPLGNFLEHLLGSMHSELIDINTHHKDKVSESAYKTPVLHEKPAQQKERRRASRQLSIDPFSKKRARLTPQTNGDSIIIKRKKHCILITARAAGNGSKGTESLHEEERWEAKCHLCKTRFSQKAERWLDCSIFKHK